MDREAVLDIDVSIDDAASVDCRGRQLGVEFEVRFDVQVEEVFVDFVVIEIAVFAAESIGDLLWRIMLLVSDSDLRRCCLFDCEGCHVAVKYIVAHGDCVDGAWFGDDQPRICIVDRAFDGRNAPVGCIMDDIRVKTGMHDKHDLSGQAFLFVDGNFRG